MQSPHFQALPQCVLRGVACSLSLLSLFLSLFLAPSLSLYEFIESPRFAYNLIRIAFLMFLTSSTLLRDTNFILRSLQFLFYESLSTMNNPKKQILRFYSSSCFPSLHITVSRRLSWCKNGRQALCTHSSNQQHGLCHRMIRSSHHCLITRLPPLLNCELLVGKTPQLSWGWYPRTQNTRCMPQKWLLMHFVPLHCICTTIAPSPHSLLSFVHYFPSLLIPVG